MDCNQCSEDLTAFLDGELSKADSDQVSSHLDFCISCSEELRSLRETTEFVESHNCKLEPDAASWNLVRARIAAQKIAPSPGFWILNRRRLALATLAILATFATVFIQHEQTQRKNLDKYISEYVQQREDQLKAQPVDTWGDINSPAENPYAGNPFIKIKATTADNPFRSEDR
jgi:anti-sigma factor RsiW